MDGNYGKQDETRCRYCGGKLSFIQRMSRQEFCTPEHRQSFQQEQEELALARLQLALDPLPEALPVQEAAVSDGDRFEPEPELFEDIPEAEPGSGFADAEPEAPGFGAPLVSPPAPVAAQIPCQDDMAQEAMPGGETAFPALRCAVQPRPWAPIGGSPDLRGLVSPAAGDLLTIFVLPPAEETAELKCRLPAMGLERSVWDRIEHEEQVRLSEPPMAGLVPIKGPQTLKVEVGLSRPNAEPEHPVASPQTAVPIPNTARTAGPRMGGVRAFRTRIGTSGPTRPRTGDADQPLEVQSSATPSMPRMSSAGLANSALGAKAGPEEHSTGTGATGSGLAGNGGDSATGDLRMDGSQIPMAGYRSLGGGPLDRAATARMCPAEFPPFDIPGIRALLDAGVYDRSVPVVAGTAKAPAAGVPEDPGELSECPPQTPALLPPLACQPELGALPTGTPVPGYQVINLISIRGLDPERKPAGSGPLSAAEPPEPRPPAVGLRPPALSGAGCQAGVETQGGGRGPRRDEQALEPAISGKPGVWKASGASAPPPVLRPGRLAGLILVPVGADLPNVFHEEIVAVLDAAGVEPVTPRNPAVPSYAVVPVHEEWVRWPIRPKDSVAEPDLQAIGCSFASGGGLWDSLT